MSEFNLSPSESPHLKLPRVLRIETGSNDEREMTNDLFVTLLDYRVYQSVPAWWRKIEQALRLDFYLAYRARAMSKSYDLIWAGSEKVAVPLSLMGLAKPLIVTLHYPQSTLRALMLKWMNVARHWAAIGYVSPADREFLKTKLDYPVERLFPIQGLKLDHFRPGSGESDGPIMSVGVTKRDYATLVAALADLPGYATEIYASSRFGDAFRGQVSQPLPAWVNFTDRIDDAELLARYQRARFIVTPLENTAQASAGVNSVLEASACGKAVIATRTKGTPSYLIEGETGLLVPPNDVAALRAAIHTLWSQPELGRTMGNNGRRFVEQNFDPRRINAAIERKVLEVYRAALDARDFRALA